MTLGGLSEGPVVVLGAGYAGLKVAHEVHRRGRGKLRVLLVDRHPLHVLRTELYEVGRLALRPDDPTGFAIPIAQALDGAAVEFRTGEVESIDLRARSVRLNGETLPFGSLAICLGSSIAYYGVPGAGEYTEQVYRLSGARRLADRLKALELASNSAPDGVRPRVIVVGGGSTGTEVAAEIATTNWSKVVGREARPPSVTLVAGAVPFLAGLPPPLVSHARDLLAKAGVELLEGLNATRVEPGRLRLGDDSSRPFELCVWCAGLQAPPVVRLLDAPHGKAGRLRVNEMLEVPGHAGVFAVGDVIEFQDPKTLLLVPGTAQAALAEARAAGANLVARSLGRPMKPFVYRERGTIVAVGVGRASGTVRSLTVWGSPAALLKRLTEREYSLAARQGRSPPGL